MFFGSQRFVKSVIAAHAAALGAFYTIKRGDRVGGIIFNEDGYDFIPPRRNKGLVEYYLQCIVKRNSSLPLRKEIKPNTALLNDMLRRTASSVTHDYVITIISDFSMIDAQTKELLQNISYHNDVILIHIYDVFEEELPDGKLVLTDGKRQITWNNNKHHWRMDYRKSFTEMRTRLTEEFRHTRIPVVFFNTTESLEDQVMHQMGKILTK
jgi:uncharacterized protein (DUF58 family)